jgi:O-antigen/teichoic acid export membrane protein
MKKIIVRLYRDSLLRNSVYLMLTTGAMAVFGFFFWLICARLFSPDEIGVATSLISAMTLIADISILGFDSTFVRLLPSAKNKNELINTGFAVAAITATTLSVGYIVALPYLTPLLDIVRRNFFYAAGFAAITVITAANALAGNVFIAFRNAKYNFINDGCVNGTVKVCLPFFVAGMGAYGIFAASGIAAFSAMAAGFAFLAVKFGYKPQLRIDTAVWRNVFRYSFSNYIANIFIIAPALVMPLIVISQLGASAAGYYYMSFMIANLLYAVSHSVSQSLFAEGSHDGSSLKKLLARAALIVGAITIPAGAAMAIAGPLILQFFGKSYGIAGASIIALLALAAPAIGAAYLGITALRIMKKTKMLVAASFVYFLAVSGSGIIFAGRGLAWVAASWIAGGLLSSLVSLSSIIFDRYRGAAK